MAGYAQYAAGVDHETPFKLFSQHSFSFDLNIGRPLQSKVPQHSQQQHLKHVLHQHFLSQQQQQQQRHAQQPLQRPSISTLKVWTALLVAVILAVVLTCTPVGYPVKATLHNWSSSSSAVYVAESPAAALIKCKVQQGSGSINSLCAGDMQYDGGVREHITIWQQASITAGTGGAPTPDVPDDLDQQGDGAWEFAHGRRLRHKQQHRKLLRLV